MGYNWAKNNMKNLFVSMKQIYRMKRIFTIFLLAISISSYAVDVDLLKQSLVGTWHPNGKDGDDPNDEEQLYFFLNGNQLMVRYVSDYSWTWGDKDNKIFNEYKTSSVKVNYDGTVEFSLDRTETGYDKNGREERKGWGEYSYNFFLVDGRLIGTETWGCRYLLIQPQNSRGLVRFRTIEQAQRRGNVSAFPFGDKPFTTNINYHVSDYANIKKFYGNGRIDEISNCNPDDYEYGTLIGRWRGSANLPKAGWCGESPFMDIEIFIKDNQYYLVYCDSRRNTNRVVERIYPEQEGGVLSFSYNAKQEFWGECEGYDWPWEYVFVFNLERVFDDRNEEWLYGTRERISVSGPLDACGIPEPEYLQFRYFKSTLK